MNTQIGGYDRRVTEGKNFTEVTITWPSGTRTPSHNHNTYVQVKVVAGCIFEIRDGVKTYYRAGESFAEGEEGSNGGRHIVGNDSDEEAVTYHLYGGKLEMQTFPDDPIEIAALKTTAEV